MKTTALFSAVVLFVFSAMGAQPPAWLLESTTPASQMHLLWQTEPGVRYDLWTTEDLITWDHAPGYPALADSLTREYPFTLSPHRFFRFYPIDEQPPVIVAQFPADNGFAVGRFADLSIHLDDASDIDPNSIHLTVGRCGWGGRQN